MGGAYQQSTNAGEAKGCDTTAQHGACAEAADVRRAPLGVKFKALYGSGALIEGVTTAGLTYFLLYYLTAVCGLSGTLAGTVMFLGLLVDALADPLIGLASDQTQSRFGRRLPYLLFGTLPLAVMFALLFSIPAGMEGTALMFYATLCSIAVRVGQSVVNLPYVAVGGEVTDDYNERSSIVAYRVSFSMLGVCLGIGLGLGVFMTGPAGMHDRSSYIAFAWTCAAVICLAGCGGAWATRSVLPRLHVTAPAGRSGAGHFAAEMRDLFRTRSFVALFAGTLAFFVAQGMAGGLALYLNKYFWNLSAPGVQFVLTAATLGPFLGLPAHAMLAPHVEKRKLTMLYFAAFIVTQMWAPLARMADMLPFNESAITGILVCNALVGGAALIGASIGAQSMMVDAVDEHEYLFGVRREGLFFSGLAFALKAAGGLGGFLAGISLDLIHFPTEMANKGTAAAIPADAIDRLGMIAGPLPALVTVLAPLALLGYTLTRQRHTAILHELAARRLAAVRDTRPGDQHR